MNGKNILLWVVIGLFGLGNLGMLVALFKQVPQLSAAPTPDTFLSSNLFVPTLPPPPSLAVETKPTPLSMVVAQPRKSSRSSSSKSKRGGRSKK